MLEIWHAHDSESSQAEYNRIYHHEGLLQRDSYYIWLINLLIPTPGKKLIDISCGQGRLVYWAQKAGLIAIGCDFAIAGVQEGKGTSSDSGWVVGDGERLPFQNSSLDYVTHIGSLEHYMHPKLGAQEIARILKPDGKACILLPNAFGAWGNVKYVWLNGDIFDDGQPLQRYATRVVWERLLKESGLKIEKVIGYGEIDWPRTSRDFFGLLSRPQKIVRAFINLFIPLNLSNHFVFICTRA